LRALVAEITELELVLDGPISSAKKYAVKKDIAKKRAVKIKEERRLSKLAGGAGGAGGANQAPAAPRGGFAFG
jgi:hypothetical protein